MAIRELNAQVFDIHRMKVMQFKPSAKMRKMQEERQAKPPATCAICGPGDAMYPLWAGDCDHTEQERQCVST